MKDPILLDGRAVVEADLASRVAKIKEQTHKTPVLATILVGDDPASATYVRMKGNACSRVGMDSLKVKMPARTTTQQLLNQIGELNKNDRVCGILLQHPVPPGIDEQACFNAISLEKDVDGVTASGFGRMALGLPAYKSATPLAIMEILKRYNIPIEGREAVVIGRSPILGKPVAMLLLNQNATLTVCHSKTRNLAEIVRRADIVVAAVGRPEFIKAGWVKPGAVLIDAGYNPGNVGDIELKNAAPLSSSYTPVPGGVGPVTIAMLMRQTVESAEKRFLSGTF
jgi:methylenetetrahydrofolate dehydrogenase (NADP+)/methenyltetrahydrofolate cyclohydrolase